MKAPYYLLFKKKILLIKSCKTIKIVTYHYASQLMSLTAYSIGIDSIITISLWRLYLPNNIQ
jgi:hypothetical protein